MNWVLCLSLSDGLTSAKGIWDEANRGRERNERERPGAPRTHQATGSSQSAHCRPQGQSRRAPVGSLWASGPQVTHQQRGVAVGPHPWGVRGLAQARLQAAGVCNPGWVLCGLHGLCWAHTHTHTYIHRQVPRADLDPPLPQSTTGTEAQSVVRHLSCHLPAQGPSLSQATADKDSSTPGSHLCPYSVDPTSESRAAEGRPMLTCLASALGPPWTSDGPARSLPLAFGSHLPPSPSCTMASTVSRCPGPCPELEKEERRAGTTGAGTLCVLARAWDSTTQGSQNSNLK